jgi:hypothetical protein
MRVSFNSNASITLLEQELLTSKKHPSSLTAFNGVRVAQSLVFCVVFARSLLSFLFLLASVLSIILFDIRHLIIALVFSHMIFV